MVEGKKGWPVTGVEGQVVGEGEGLLLEVRVWRTRLVRREARWMAREAMRSSWVRLWVLLFWWWWFMRVVSSKGRRRGGGGGGDMCILYYGVVDSDKLQSVEDESG